MTGALAMAAIALVAGGCRPSRRAQERAARPHGEVLVHGPICCG
jgi:hypothetical protein